MSDFVGAITEVVVFTGSAPSSEAWFAGGERLAYDPKARGIIAGRDAPLKIFLRREGRRRTRCLLAAWISRRVIRVGEGQAAFA